MSGEYDIFNIYYKVLTLFSKANKQLLVITKVPTFQYCNILASLVLKLIEIKECIFIVTSMVNSF